MLENENILLQRFAATGDAEAFSQIVQRHAGLVYGACLRVLADNDRAADAVQETFLQLLRNAANITGSVPNWLHKVATRKAIDVIRRDSSRRRHEAKYAADKPREVTQWQDLSRYVDEGLEVLDEQTRAILIQRFFQGRTTTDIADGQGISQPTVSRRIDSGVNQLREKLRKRGIIVAAAALAAMLGENAVQAAPAVVLQELGKIALVGSPAAAAAGVGTVTTVSGAGAAKAAAGGVLAGVKAKVITAAAVTIVGVGSVATYNHVTRPSKVDVPPAEATSQQYSRSPSRTPPSPIQTQPAAPAPVNRAAQDSGSLEWEQFRAEMFAAQQDTDVTRPTASPIEIGPEEPEAEATTGGGGMYGGGGGYAGAPASPAEAEEKPSEDSNQPPVTQPPAGYGGYGYSSGGGGYRSRSPRPKEPEKPAESEDDEPTRRD